MQTAAPLGADYRPVLRDPIARDSDFITDSWLKQYRESSPLIQHIEAGRYRRAFLPIVGEILKTATIRVAVSPTDSLVIYGYAIYDAPKGADHGTLHMAYFRRSWRRMGIGCMLLWDLNLNKVHYSTVTQDFYQWMRHKWRFGEYRPFWLAKENQRNG